MPDSRPTRSHIVPAKSSLEEVWQNLLNNLHKLKRPESEIEIITQAFILAKEGHKTQFRKSGEPYIIHPVNVGLILTQLDADAETICAGLLHDTLEDTPVKASEIEKQFGIEVKDLVEGVTKLNKLSFASKQEIQAENFRKMFVAIAADMRVVLVKLADRLHNMKTLESMTLPKQQEIARETLDIFAPLANRFGLGHLKWQLEDLAFRYLKNEDYRNIEKMVNENRGEREDYLAELIESLKVELAKAGIKAEIKGRAKHFYSIYEKLEKLQTEEIFDLLAVRVIVERERQCYEILGIVHDMFSPIPGRFKDYIAIPKSNLYQSLHTTVIGPKQKLFEIQIRTADMHRIAEFGLAAHWKYKEDGKSTKSNSNYDQQFSQLRQKLVDMQLELPDANDYKKAVQLDIFADEIFVLSPKGDIYRLPKNSTPIDFAYYVHSQIGDRCIGAKVNDRLVSLSSKLRNGDIIEIQTSKNAHPSLDWLGFIQSSSAKSKIKQWFKKNRRDEYIQSGFSMLSEAISKSVLDDLIKKGIIKQISAKMGLNSDDELFVRLASGDISTVQIISRLKNDGHLLTKESNHKNKEEKDKDKEDYLIKKPTPKSEIQSLKDLMHSFSKCCQPIPGENIVGLISKGRGIVIHRQDCPNLKGLEESRLMDISWGDNSKNEQCFSSTLEVECVDRIGISRDILDKIANAKLNILDVRVITRPTKHTALVRVAVEVQNIVILEKLIQSIKKLSDVIEIKRYTLRSLAKSVNSEDETENII